MLYKHQFLTSCLQTSALKNDWNYFNINRKDSPIFIITFSTWQSLEDILRKWQK